MNEIEKLRKIFIKYLTEDSKTQNINHEDFNHAIFNKDGWVRFGNIHVDMVLHKFGGAMKELTRRQKGEKDEKKDEMKADS